MKMIHGNHYLNTRVGWLFCFLTLAVAGGCGIKPTAPDVSGAVQSGEDRVQDGPPEQYVDLSNVPNAVPRPEPRSRYGNPRSYEVFGRTYYTMDSSEGHVERGIASWYGKKFHGRRTSSGETYDMYAMTAAHTKLPLPSYARVTNLENGRQVIVKINDRGPFHDNRVIDLSYAAATRLGMADKGTALVEVKTIDTGQIPAGDPDLRQVAAVSNPAVSTDRFYIQVGAFSDPKNAEELRARIDQLCSELVKVQRAVVNNQTIYRVRVGPIQDVEKADQLVAGMADLGIVQHQIIPE